MPRGPGLVTNPSAARSVAMTDSRAAVVDPPRAVPLLHEAASLRARVTPVVLLFAGTTFVASALLFSVQPMFAKMVLPRLGGSPAVWAGCVLFFQSALLVGYLYSHVTTRWMPMRLQAILHLLPIAAAFAILPLTIGSQHPSPDADPVVWLLWTMLARLGLPFVVLATMAPLLQRWFASLPVRSASDPYFLYAASNAGSLIALLAYPLVLEPWLGIVAQTRVWTAGYALLALLTACCASLVVRRGATPEAAARGGTTLSWGSRVRWTALAFVPSSLMLGVTAHVSTDLASVPLLWVVPLAAYLLTFVMAFGARTVPDRALHRALPMMVLAVLLSMVLQRHALWVMLLHLATFFVAALVCHVRLSRSRPPAEHLTEFYLWLSVGGVIGGLFNTLGAPHTFPGIFEYPIVLALACLARESPAYRRGGREPWPPLAMAALLPGVICFGFWTAGGTPTIGVNTVLVAWALVSLGILAAANRRAPFNVLVLVCVVALLTTMQEWSPRGRTIFAGRSFFGVTRVIEAPDHSYRLLQHGTTIHGWQNLPVGSCEPQAYYSARGPLGEIFSRAGVRFATVAVVGLGTGAIACYADRGSAWTFVDVDPLVERVARDERLFSFLRETQGDVRVEIADGRRAIENAEPESYDLLVLDAFSSDAVPVHLITAEAFAAYLGRLRSGGLIAVHISNRYVDLEPVLGDLVAQEGLAALTNPPDRVSESERRSGRMESRWVVIAPKMEALAYLQAAGWRSLRRLPGVSHWTDDYSNLLAAIDFIH